eukprot:1968611-Amphidinium_carterae.1
MNRPRAAIMEGTFYSVPSLLLSTSDFDTKLFFFLRFRLQLAKCIATVAQVLVTWKAGGERIQALHVCLPNGIAVQGAKTQETVSNP